MSSKNTNKLNVPQARAAMDILCKFCIKKFSFAAIDHFNLSIFKFLHENHIIIVIRINIS